MKPRRPWWDEAAPPPAAVLPKKSEVLTGDASGAPRCASSGSSLMVALVSVPLRWRRRACCGRSTRRRPTCGWTCRTGAGAAQRRARADREGALLDADAWIELLRSYIVLDQVVRDLRLYLGVPRPADRELLPTFAPSTRSGWRLRAERQPRWPAIHWRRTRASSWTVEWSATRWDATSASSGFPPRDPAARRKAEFSGVAARCLAPAR